MVDAIRVERMVRDIISAGGLPIELVAVLGEGRQWRIVVRDASHRVLDVHVSKTDSNAELRAQLIEQLNAASQ
jgi:hypothetical protein